jgi:hypothetical protein
MLVRWDRSLVMRVPLLAVSMLARLVAFVIQVGIGGRTPHS